MEEDAASANVEKSSSTGEKNHHPISLYMIFVADVILIGFVVYMAIVAIF